MNNQRDWADASQKPSCSMDFQRRGWQLSGDS